MADPERERATGTASGTDIFPVDTRQGDKLSERKRNILANELRLHHFLSKNIIIRPDLHLSLGKRQPRSVLPATDRGKNRDVWTTVTNSVRSYLQKT